MKRKKHTNKRKRKVLTKQATPNTKIPYQEIRLNPASVTTNSNGDEFIDMGCSVKYMDHRNIDNDRLLPHIAVDRGSSEDQTIASVISVAPNITQDSTRMGHRIEDQIQIEMRGRSSGIHPPYADTYRRRVTTNIEDRVQELELQVTRLKHDLLLEQAITNGQKWALQLLWDQDKEYVTMCLTTLKDRINSSTGETIVLDLDSILRTICAKSLIGSLRHAVNKYTWKVSEENE